MDGELAMPSEGSMSSRELAIAYFFRIEIVHIYNIIILFFVHIQVQEIAF